MFTQSIKFSQFYGRTEMSEKHDSQVGSKNGWLLLSVTFTEKFGLDFVLTFENAFSKGFEVSMFLCDNP